MSSFHIDFEAVFDEARQTKPIAVADLQTEFWNTVTGAVGLSMAKRLPIWPTALATLQALVVKHFKQVKARPDLHGKLARFHKLAGLVKGEMGDTEREAMYLAAFQAGESVLVPFGFTAGMEKLRADMSVTEATRRAISQAELEELARIFKKLAGMLPWKGVRIEVDAATVGDDEASTFWDSANRRLVFCVNHARLVRKNLTDLGVYSTLVGQIIAPMLTPPHPITDTLSALVLTAELGKALGAKDTMYEPLTGQREPPDMYRGAADKVFRAVWNEPRTAAELSQLAPKADIPRILQMFATDGQTNKWKVVSNGNFLTIIAA